MFTSIKRKLARFFLAASVIFILAGTPIIPAAHAMEPVCPPAECG